VIVQDLQLAPPTTRRPKEQDAPSLFEVIFANQRTLEQLATPELGTTRDPRTATDSGSGPADARAAAAVPNVPTVAGSEALSQEVRAHEIAPSEARSEVTRSARHAEPTPPVTQPTDFMINQGTLPVIVAGQLVELTVLRERRAPQDAVSTRRLSMTLRPASADEVRIDAHVDGDRLVVQFAGSGATDATSCARHADEVRSLAQRLGWTFAEMIWGATE